MQNSLLNFFKSSKEKTYGDQKSIHRLSVAQKDDPIVNKNPEEEAKFTGVHRMSRVGSTLYRDRDKMTVALQRDGERTEIVVILESEDQEAALNIKMEEIREKAANTNYNWEIFDIKQELGAGTFGQVFACLDRKSGQNFALKFINYEEETEQDIEFKAAVREIVIMQSLLKANCPAILKIHDVYPCIKDEQKYLVLVMELCDCNLMELIKVRIEENKSKWTDEELFFILKQLIQGLVEMKKRSITHRDIKPQNILYSNADKSYKIADLGGAKFLKPQKAQKQQRKYGMRNEEDLNTVRGSPAYWAPEIYYFCDLQKDKEGRFFVGKQFLPYDPYQSDVYSVGITMLLMKKLVPRLDRDQIKQETENLKKIKNPSPMEVVLLKLLEPDDSARGSFEELLTQILQEKEFGKQPNEEVFVNCLKTNKEKKNMPAAEMMQKEIKLADAYEKLYLLQHAKAHYEQALKYAQKLSKDSHKADILNSLGTVNCDLGLFDEAEKNYLESVISYKKMYGDKHSSVADAYNNLGIVKRKKGDYDKAIKYYEQASAIKELVFGENNLGGALILGNIGLAYRKLGNLDQAIRYFKNSLQIKKLICGDRSLILCSTYDNLARVYFMKQQYDMAISCYQITAEIYRKYVSSNQIRLADALFELGLCFQNVGRFSDAVKAFEETYHIRKQHVGLYLKETIVSQEHLAQCLLEEQNYEKSVEIYENLKHIYNKGLIKCSIDERVDSIIDILKNLGAGYMGLSNYQKSIENYKEAEQQLQKRQVDKKVQENSRMARILYNMGLVYRKMNVIDKAKQYYTLACQQIQNSQIQGDIMLLGDIYNNMGVLYGMVEQYEIGKQYFGQALEKYQLLFGKEHQLCREVEANMGEIEKLVNSNSNNKP